MFILLRSICTSKPNLLRRELMLVVLLSMYLLSINLKSNRNSRLTTCSDLIKLAPLFQKLLHVKFLQNYLSSSGFLCPTIVNYIPILHYNYLELNKSYCHYHGPNNSILKTTAPSQCRIQKKFADIGFSWGVLKAPQLSQCKTAITFNLVSNTSY